MDTDFYARKTRTVSQNPFIQTIHTADPSAHVWEDGRMYIYASRDMDPPRGCDMMDHYHVYSTGDLVNWRDEGEILWSGDVEWGRPEGGFMWAPDCAYRDGKYYFYFPHPSDTKWNDSWKIGVAVSTHPGKDFKSIVQYAMSKNPLGPWEYKGVYLEPTGCDTSHGSVVCFKGEWYALYHCCDISSRGNLRSICIDPIVFNEDGTMQTVIQSRNGRRPVGSAPVKNVDMKIYGAQDAELTGGARMEELPEAYQNKAIQGLDISDASVTFRRVEGFGGGRVNIGFYYAARRKPAPLAKLRLLINGEDWSLLNFPWTGTLDHFSGYANITVRLRPGADNTIQLLADSGEISLEALDGSLQ